MPAMAQDDIQRSRVLAQPPRALLTPSASPSVGPPDRPRTKRPRLRSTPSSAVSATPSTSNESSTSADVNSARRASTLRVLNTWAQLAERYNKRLDEDDIIDLHRYVIVKDRGAVEGASKEYDIGHFTLDGDQEDADADQDQEDSEQEDDDNELNALPPSEATTDDDAPISKKELLRGVPPLSTTTDAEDLKEFLQAEKRRRELAGDDDDGEEMSTEQRAALKKELEERLRKREAAIANQARDAVSSESFPEPEVDATPTRPSTRDLPSDDESEDELALWAHDESTAVYPIARDESEQDAHEVQEVIELTESDSDAEFEALLTHPPRFALTSPLLVPQPEEVQPSLQSPLNSERGRSKPRPRSCSKTKSARAIPEGEHHRPHSPLEARKPEVILHKRKSLVPKETGATISDDGLSDTEAITCISPILKGKGKGKERPAPILEGNRREKTPESLRVASQDRKRKRIASSSSATPSTQSPAELKSTLRSHRKSISQTTMHSQLDDPEPALDEDVSTPTRSKPALRSHSRPLSSFISASKSQPPTLSVPAYRPSEAESVQQSLQCHNSDGRLYFDPPSSAIHSYSQRHPSHPPSIFSPSQGAPGISLPGHPPPPLDPAQAQQAQYLLAQAMHQLSYLLSATVPYTAYVSNPGQPWHPPSAPPPHTAHSTPIYHPLHVYDTRHYHTPSSSISRSGLPLSSPVRSSVSPPLARNRGRSRSRGRRVSFKLDNEETIAVREHITQSELQLSGKKNHHLALEARGEKGKGRAGEESAESLRFEDRDSPPREVARGRTPGPPDRRKSDVPRGRSLNR